MVNMHKYESVFCFFRIEIKVDMQIKDEGMEKSTCVKVT